MKRFLCGAAAAVQMLFAVPLTAAAVVLSEPADLEQAVYEQLAEEDTRRSEYGSPYYDVDGDGVITDGELAMASSLSLDLDHVTSLDFLSKFKSLKTLWLTGGTIADLSAVAECKTLVTLGLSSMPQVTDISFAGALDLRTFYIDEMPQITDEQRISILKFHDLDTDAGFSGVIGATPCRMFPSKAVRLEIADSSIACMTSSGGNAASDTAVSAYAAKPGETTYTLTYNGEVLRTGTIRVGECRPESPALLTDAAAPELFWSFYYAYESRVLLDQNRLLRMTADGPALIADHVKEFSRAAVPANPDLEVYTDNILYEDGTVTINGETPDMPENLRFEKLREFLLFTADHKMYICLEDHGKFRLDFVADGYQDVVPDNRFYLVNDEGEVVLLRLLRTEPDSRAVTEYQLVPTGIKNIIGCHDDYFIDGNKVLWKVELAKETTVSRIASKVTFVGYRYYDGNTYGCVYITEDGRAYNVRTGKAVTLSDPKKTEWLYTEGDSFWEHLGTYESAFVPENYHLTADGVLTLEQNGKRTAISDVSMFIKAVGDPDSDNAAAYFVRNDGTLWYYSFRTGKYTLVGAQQEKPPVTAPDLTGDGIAGKADVLLLTDVLLNRNSAVTLPDTADLNGDSVLDARDLTLLKRAVSAVSPTD